MRLAASRGDGDEFGSEGNKMSPDPQSPRPVPPRQTRKPLWPWLLLLALTLMAIYSYNRIFEITEDVMRDMSPAIIEMFRDLLDGSRDQPGGPGIDVRVEPVRPL